MSSFGDSFGNPFGGGEAFVRAAADAARRKGTTDKPLPALRGKRIDGVLYIRAEDLADALESQAPKQCDRLIKKLRAAASAR